MIGQLPTAQHVERALGVVYARPEFTERELPGLLQWLADVYARASTAFRDALARLIPLDPTISALEWALIIWLTGTAVALLLHLAWTSAALWRGRDRGRGDAAEPAAAAGRTRSPAEWERRAREAAAAGRLREAAAALYQALLLRLDERGAVRYDPAKTPGDYRRELTADAAAAAALDRFLRRFEPVAFGGRPADHGTYRALCAAAAEAGNDA